MLPRYPHAVLTRHHFFAVCLLAIGAIAAAPNDADVDDGGAGASDATISAPDASTGATGPDATVSATLDAGVAVGEASDDGSGDDGQAEGLQYVTPDGALPPYDAGNIFDLLCVPDPNVVDLDYAAFTAPYTDMAGCAAYNPLNEGHAAQRACFCSNCFAMMQQCDALPGCQQIVACSFKTGCDSANTCYLIQAECADVINQWGESSVSTGLALNILNCGQAASPACPQ